MSRSEKAKDRLKSVPKDYTFTEAENLLNSLGFERYNKGKTSGLRVMFIRKRDQLSILLHKPHPGNEMKAYAVRSLLNFLIEAGEV